MGGTRHGTEMGTRTGIVRVGNGEFTELQNCEFVQDYEDVSLIKYV